MKMAGQFVWCPTALSAISNFLPIKIPKCWVFLRVHYPIKTRLRLFSLLDWLWHLFKLSSTVRIRLFEMCYDPPCRVSCLQCTHFQITLLNSIASIPIYTLRPIDILLPCILTWTNVTATGSGITIIKVQHGSSVSTYFGDLGTSSRASISRAKVMENSSHVYEVSRHDVNDIQSLSRCISTDIIVSMPEKIKIPRWQSIDENSL